MSRFAPPPHNSDLVEIINALYQQNQEYRQYFTNEFVAYDPSTIDEVPLIEKLIQSKSSSTVKLRSSDCWPLICGPKMRLAGRDMLHEAGELNISSSEIHELKVPTAGDQTRFWTSLQRQVRSRDFRLIEQAHGLVAYRPTLGGRWSSGVRQEIEYVYRRLKKPFYVIKGRHDSPLDEGQALGWEYGQQYWGEWDLSSAENRTLAFETAKNQLLAGIQDHERE